MLAVGPPTKISRYRDWNDNAVHHFTIVHFHDRIEVVAPVRGEHPPTGSALAAATDARPYPEPPYPLLDFLAFEGPVRNGAGLPSSRRPWPCLVDAPLGEQVRACGRHIHEHFTYRKNVTSYESTRDDFLAGGGGASARTSPT